MKKMRRMLIAGLAIMLMFSLAGAAMTALAASKENDISTGFITAGGNFNSAEWEKQGEDTTAYTENNTGGVIEFKGTIGQGNAWLQPLTTVKKADIEAVKADKSLNQAVTLEFDIVEITDGSYPFNLVPVGWKTTPKTRDDSDRNPIIRSDNFYNGAWAAEDSIATVVPANNKLPHAGNWMGHIINFKGGFRQYYEFCFDGTLNYYTAALDKEGNLADVDEDGKPDEKVHMLNITKAFPAAGNADEYYFGFTGWADSAEHLMQFNNVKLSLPNKTIFEDTLEKDENIDKSADAKAEEGKLYCYSGSTWKNLSEMLVTNPAADNRLVSYEKVKIDEQVENAFELNGEMSLRALADGKKVGFGFGLDKPDTALDADGVSFVYFEQVSGKTQINVMKNGTAGTALALDKNLADGAFFTINMLGAVNGTITVKIGGIDEPIEFKDQNMAGLVAIGQLGEGNCTYAFKPKLTVVTYTYRAGEGKTRANNFDTGYVSPNYYAVQSSNAIMFANPDEAEGIVLEDGKLFFKGTTDNAHFALKETYADFILQFDFESLPIDKRPAQSSAWEHDYSGVGVSFAKPDPLGGWLSSCNMILITDRNKNEGSFTYIQHYNLGIKEDEVALVDKDQTTVADGMIPLYDRTTRFKIVAFKNIVTVWGVTLVDGEEQGNFVKLTEHKYKDTYGHIGFGTTEGGYFTIDNLRVTNIDGLDEIPADYDSTEPIPDTPRPSQLAAPVLSLENNVVSWSAVANAVGYEVSVNGTVMKTGSETSYTVTATKKGDYVVTVKAIGDEENYLTSVASASVTYVKAQDDPTEGGNGNGENSGDKDKTGCGGCGSTLTTGSFLIGGGALLLLAGGVLLLLRRKKRDN